MDMYKVKDLPDQDRPREKLLLRGAQNLSDTELLAILLRTGKKGKSVIHIAQDIIRKYKNLANVAVLHPEALKHNSGIGDDKAATLAAAFEISRRIDSQKKELYSRKITSPAEVAEFFIPILRDEVKENFIVVCLSTSNKIIRYETVSIGNLNSSVVHPREVFKVAIDSNAANIILVHNHPSGNSEPSNEDIKITRQMVEAGKVIGIEVFDHLIIAGSKFTSFIDRKII